MTEQAQVALPMCITHQEEEMDLYCKTCKSSTCNECMKSEHLGHDFDTVAKYYRKIKNKRQDLIHDIEQQVTRKCKLNKRRFREVKCRNENLLKTNLDNIETKRKEIHEVVGKTRDAQEPVDNIIKEYVDSLKLHATELDDRIKDEKMVFERDAGTVYWMLGTFETTTMVRLNLIEYYEGLKSKSDALEAINYSKYYNNQVYQTGDVTVDDLRKTIGEIKELHTNVPKTEQISSFLHEEIFVHTICPLKSNEAWITYAFEQEFTLLRDNGHHIKSVPTCSERHSFVLQDNEFLLCNADANNILRMDISGRETIWIDTSPLIASFIGSALNGNLLIALADEESCSRTDKSLRKVQMLSPSGNIIHQYEYGEDGTTPVFTWPTRSTQNYNSDVCAVNMFKKTTGNVRGNVCVFYEDGGLKFVHSGHDGEFYPGGICCDLLCNIIFANNSNDTIHILNSEGSFVKYLFTSETCVTRPISLALYRGVLWVGSDLGEVRVYRYIY